MKKAKKGILVFCLFLMLILVFLIPYNAKMAEPDSRFGINAFVLNRYNWEEWDKPINLLKDLRVNWTREEFIWKQIEPEKGKYDWTFYDRAFEKISGSNINVLGIIDYSAPWATDDPNRADADKYMPNPDDWRDYVGKVVERYGNKVKYWQIWNEPNLSVFFKPEPDAGKYVELLKIASQEIRLRDGNAKVVLGGLSGVDVGYLGELKSLGAGEYFDIIALHPYRFDFKSPPESGGFMDDLKKAEKASEDFNNKNIWFTEFGWPTDATEGVSEDIQAKFLARTYLMSFAFPNVKKLFWYDFRDDGYNKSYREDNFGLVKRDYTKKSSYLAYKNLINILEYSEFDKMNISKNGEIYDFFFRKNGSTIRVIWKIGGNDTVKIDDSDGKLKVFNTFGTEIPSSTANGEAREITISDFPIFIVSNGGSVENEVSYGLYYDYEFVSQSSYVSIKNDEEQEVWVQLKNTGNTHLKWMSGKDILCRKS